MIVNGMYVEHTSQTQRSVQTVVKNLNTHLDGIVSYLTEKRAMNMHATLRNRRDMGGRFGRFPRYNLKDSKKGFRHWRISQKGKMSFVLTNDARDVSGGYWTGYNYLRPVMFGLEWPAHIKGGIRLVRKGNKLFSTQMPSGLEPWLSRQRKLLKEEVSDTIARDERYNNAHVKF